MSADAARCDVAIVGDNFMLPETFESAILAACGARVELRSMRLPGPTRRWSTAMRGRVLRG